MAVADGRAAVPAVHPARRIAGLLVRFGVAGGLLWLILDSVDVDRFAERLASVDPLLAFAAGAMLFLVPLLGGQRWQLVLSALGGPRDLWRPTAMFWIGAMFGQVLPAAIGGDAVRMWLAVRDGYGTRLAVNSVLLERLVLFAVLVLIVAATIPFAAVRIDRSAPAWLPWLLAAAAVGGPAFVAAADQFSGRFASCRWLQPVCAIAGDTRRLFSNRSACLLAVLNSSINHLVVALSAWLFAEALAMPLSLADCLILMPAVLLVSAMPVSFAGWGVREGAIVLLFGAATGDPASALVVSVLIGVASIVTSLPGLLIWLVSPGGRGRPRSAAAPVRLSGDRGSGR